MHADHDSFSARLNDLSAADDRQWLAFRYVLGETSPEEAAALERILAEDQDARELVAASVGLVGNLCSAEVRGSERLVPVAASFPVALPAASDPPETRRRKLLRSVAALGSCACLIAAVGLYFAIIHGDSRFARQAFDESTQNGAGELVAIWSQGQEESAGESGPADRAAAERAELFLPAQPDSLRPAKAPEEKQAESISAADQAANEDFSVPGWLLAAVSLDDQMSPDGSPSGMREN